MTPQRRYELTAHLGADTLPDLEAALKDMLEAIQIGCRSFSARGAASGYRFCITEDPHMTPERYQELLLEELRKP